MTNIPFVSLVFWTLGSLFLATRVNGELPHPSTNVVVDIQPLKFTEGTEGNVDITCQGNTKGVRKISFLEIRNGNIIVRLDMDGIRYGRNPLGDIIPSDTTKYHAVGSIKQDGLEGHLKLSILQPDESDQGSYLCIMWSLTDNDKFIMGFNSSTELDVEILDIHQLVLSMKEEISYLKAQESKVSNEISGLKTSTHDLEKESRGLYNEVNGLKKSVSMEISGLKTSTQALEIETGGLKEELTGLKASDNVACFFNAQMVFQRGSHRGTIVYNKVIAMLGLAYNSNTGNFTAPVHGVYAFNVQFMINCGDCTVVLQIFHGEKPMCNAYVTRKLYGQSAGSCVMEMKKDETADVRQTWGDGGIRKSTFSGYLVKALY